ncbi:MAG TPA: FadR/GntR family transcriptional regulator [Bryobacteraceae bacterium]|nr:FadR/GntR family transcriptional regulator [Bryobacteraceae bacterium]
MTGTPIKRPPKLHELVARRIQELILSGKWKTGFHLPPERELCAEFGVSRPILREALKVLLARGVLKEARGKGTYVWPNMTEPLADLFDLFVAQEESNGAASLFEVRKLLEVEIAGLAAERATDEDIAHLDRLNQSMQRLHKKAVDWTEEQMHRYNDLDFQFHLFLAKCTKNALFVILMSALSGSFKSSWTHMHQKAEVRTHGIQMHERILKAIRSRDPRLARKATRENLEAFMADASRK